jgi:hypothetical protein
MIVPVLLNCADCTAQHTNPLLCLHETNVLCHVLTAFGILLCPVKIYKEALFNPDVNCGNIQSARHCEEALEYKFRVE